jgi:predicted transcriptional regulator
MKNRVCLKLMRALHDRGQLTTTELQDAAGTNYRGVKKLDPLIDAGVIELMHADQGTHYYEITQAFRPIIEHLLAL